MKKERYFQFKKRQQQRVNEFEGLFFAFNSKQFTEGMQKVNLKPDETDKIYSLPVSGGFVRKDRSQALWELIENNDKELQEALKDEEFLLDALIYELRNHEFIINGDIAPALDVLGLTADTVDRDILNKAIDGVMKET